MGWLLAWLIANALFVVWRILVTTEVETRDRMTKPEPEPTPAEILEAMRQLPLRERAALFKTIRKRAREASGCA